MTPRRTWLSVLGVAAGTFLLLACGQNGDISEKAEVEPTPALDTLPNEAGVSPAASPSVIEIAGAPYNVHGMVRAEEDVVQMTAGNFYFEPTFVQAGPEGESVTLRITNPTDTLHNFNILLPAQPVDREIPPGQTVDVEVTLPQDGAYRFFCKYHSDEGMNGQLLAEQATPQPPESVDIPPEE